MKLRNFRLAGRRVCFSTATCRVYVTLWYNTPDTKHHERSGSFRLHCLLIEKERSRVPNTPRKINNTATMASDQIRQMVNFILQEAHEKANEIRVKVRSSARMHDFGGGEFGRDHFHGLPTMAQVEVMDAARPPPICWGPDSFE